MLKVKVFLSPRGLRMLYFAHKPTCEPHSPVDAEAVFLPARASLTLANLQWPVVLQGVLGLEALGAGV